jgi:hypothetical protein
VNAGDGKSAADRSAWWSLREIFNLMPIGEDAGSVEGNMHSIQIGLDDRCWRLERLHIQRDLTDLQLHDDSNDEDGLAKIDTLERDLRNGATFPPMVGVRETDGLVSLHDGRHRYNAYLRASMMWAPVWVAAPDSSHP